MFAVRFPLISGRRSAPFLLASAALFLAPALPAAPAGGPLEFKDGDKILLVGNTVIERAQTFGYLETALTLAAGEGTNVTFRNLAWSGDTVYGDARSYFGPPEEGFERLEKGVGEIKPNIIFACYGAVAAFEGKAGLDNFVAGYERLLDMLSKASGAREIVLISPPPAENSLDGVPDLTAQNENLALYGDAIRSLAEKRGHCFVDWFTPVTARLEKADDPLTGNGIHYVSDGYLALAEELVRGLGYEPSPLLRDEKAINSLRVAIVEKDRLFFHRWRPANETYLFLFRKHEQGQNAAEIPMFDPLIEEKEKEIATLKAEALKLAPKVKP